MGQTNNGTPSENVKSQEIKLDLGICRCCGVKFEKDPADSKDLPFCSHYCRRKIRKM